MPSSGCKVYVHLDLAEWPAVTLPVEVPRPEATQFGTIKQAFLKHCTAACPDQAPLQYDACCFWNHEFCPIADRAPVAMHSWEHNDFFLRLLPEGETAASSALAASRQERGELSYYYAHDRSQQKSLVSKPRAAQAASTPAATESRAPLAAKPGGGKGAFNFKQSPFGTDITGYESITTYTWEDHDSTVKVLLPLEGVGRLPSGAVRSQFGLRSFEVLIDGYNGKNLRFATYKTHGEMSAEECKHMVRANRVTIVLKKGKEKDIWFDLFKKRAIGDDDDP